MVCCPHRLLIILLSCQLVGSFSGRLVARSPKANEIRAYDRLRHVGNDELPSEHYLEPQVEKKSLDAVRADRRSVS